MGPTDQAIAGSGMSGEIDVTNPASPTRILMVIANPATSTTLGIPVGFWGAELTHSSHLPSATDA